MRRNCPGRSKALLGTEGGCCRFGADKETQRESKRLKEVAETRILVEKGRSEERAAGEGTDRILTKGGKMMYHKETGAE